MKHKPKISFGGKNTPLLRSLSEAEMPKEGLGAVFKGWKPLLYALLLSLASCKSCKKDIDLLPPETQTGANTFGCLVDGKPWLPQKGTGFGAAEPLIGGYINALPPIYYNKSNVWIQASTPSQGISIYLRNVDTIGKYPLNFDTGPRPQLLHPLNYASFRIKSTPTTPEEFYITTRNYTGEVEITKADTINRIVSGRFSFTAYDYVTGKTIKVTNGRFDCKTGL